jgi:16S rRNA (guanine527-N7)-methyltransferase
VSQSEFAARLCERAERIDLRLDQVEVDRLSAYFALLRTWNHKINLTALPLDPLSDQAISRLFVEPLVAGRFIAQRDQLVSDQAAELPQWYDLGSGGGSPAIPMKIVLPAMRLAMIESKSRKAAFLREAIRAVRLEDTDVVNARFDEVTSPAGAALVTARAVRLDSELVASVGRLLRAGGAFAYFSSNPDASSVAHDILTVEHLSFAERSMLATEPMSWLHVFSRDVPRGTQDGR